MPDNKILYMRGRCGKKNDTRARRICKNTTQKPISACKIDYERQGMIKIDYPLAINVDKESLSRISRKLRALEKIAKLR